MPVLPSYLQSKSIDWFLYKGNTGISWVNTIITALECSRSLHARSVPRCRAIVSSKIRTKFKIVFVDTFVCENIKFP